MCDPPVLGSRYGVCSSCRLLKHRDPETGLIGEHNRYAALITRLTVGRCAGSNRPAED